MILTASVTTAVSTNQFQLADAFGTAGEIEQRNAAPIATSGDNNVYITWWANKTGNDEVMFKASTDGGKTFRNNITLSNSGNSESQDAQIVEGNNVYVSW